MEFDKEDLILAHNLTHNLEGTILKKKVFRTIDK